MAEREDALEEFAESVVKWSEAYPIDIFTEPTLEQVDEVCKLLGFRIDRISAMVLREFTKPWGSRAKQALAVIDARSNYPAQKWRDNMTTKELYEALKKFGNPYSDGKLCFCDMAIGSPMVTSHSADCEFSRYVLKMYEEAQQQDQAASDKPNSLT